MDPFLGLGSSAVAAAELKLDFIGVELDEHYLKEALGQGEGRPERQRAVRAQTPQAKKRPEPP